jgi:hypothetical protein
MSKSLLSKAVELYRRELYIYKSVRNTKREIKGLKNV